MSDTLREFVAEDLWLLLGIVTFALVAVFGAVGLEILAGPMAIIGWFLITPIFLFWGEEIAEVLFDDEEVFSTPEPEDPIDLLKHRYATGEIDDEEFEHRLERLLDVDELPDGVFSSSRETREATIERLRE